MSFWLLLISAIIMEVCGTTCMKLSEGFTRLIPSVLIWVFYGVSFASLTFALKGINLGVAYAIWAGVGTALVAVIGIFFFKEPATALKLVSLGLVIIGVAGLYFSEVSY